MKRLAAVIILCWAVGAVSAEETDPSLSFGMEFVVDYDIVGGSFNLWDLRYGLGLDFLVHLGSSFYLGVEALALFGFHKQMITDPTFDRIYVQFPIHASLSVFFLGWSAQLYAGAAYTGAADITGGTVYAEDFSFRLLPDVGAKIGWGTVHNIFLKGGYVFDGYVYFGLGARLGLF